MEISAQELAGLLNGKLQGDGDVKVNTLSKIEEGVSGSISFLSNPAYTEYIYSTQSSVVIVPDIFVAEKELKYQPTLIFVADPRMSFSKLLEIYNQQKNDKIGISSNASIAKSAKIGKDVFIADFAVVGENVVIGDNTKLFSHVCIGDNVKIGSDCTLHTGVKVIAESRIGNHCIVQSSSVIGSDGFGFVPNAANDYHKVIHIGNVIIEDHVEIGANTTIDRATLGSTIIKKGVKLDNLIQIAHNVEIGENTVIAAQTGIAGSTKIGKNCMIGGQVGIVGHIEIADEVKIAAQSGIGTSIKEKGMIVQGSPAFAIGDYKRSLILFKALPKLKQQLDEILKKINLNS